MGRSAAMLVALSLLERPSAVRYAVGSPLPGGVTLLLQVAAGEPEALRYAKTRTGRSHAVLQEAADFFIEQVLLHPKADSYRILGASPRAPRTELRQHMALLVKWLHPDTRPQRVSRADFDRAVFVHRATQAWEHLKTDERRADYDRTLAELAKSPAPAKRKRPAARASRSREQHRQKQPEVRQAKAAASAKRTRRLAIRWPDRRVRSRRLSIYSFEPESLWTRLCSFLWMRT
jgi:hypothetical protein